VTRRLLALTPLITVGTGCPHAFGRGGTIEMALRKDMSEYYSNRACHMPHKRWLEFCDNRNGRKIQPECPKACRPQE
jgi:hypothetical protein